ncbi:MAG: ribosomal protein S18-alanine N-acetyltransferase [Candidatus Zixiibacteriota bacterium]
MDKTIKTDLKKFKIRPMTAADVSKIVMMEMEVFTDPWPKAAFTEELDRPNRGILIAESNGVITGYAAYIVAFGEAHLTNIAVAPPYRGKNIAKILLNCILGIAREAECENIFLDVRPSNKPAIELYKKFGFYDLYVRPNYYHSPAENAIVMVKNLREED